MAKRTQAVGSRTTIGIREIARETNVSVATVSRVLNGHETVSEKLRQRVSDTIARLGYRPNLVARNLRTQHTSTVGVVIPDIGNAHFSDAVRAMQDAAASARYTVLVVNSDGQKEKEDAALRTLFERQVDGVILVSASTAASPALSSMVQQGTPVLAMDRAIKDLPIDHVLVNTFAGTRDAVLHLAGQQRRRIAFIAGPKTNWTAAEKLRGYRDGLRRAGLEWDASLVLPGDYTLPSGEAQALALLALKPRPDAVIIANNLMTLGAMRVFLRHSISVPHDLALVGYDNADWTDVVRPAVTVVSQPTYELGRRSIGSLLARLENPDAKPSRILLDTELIVRESSSLPDPS